MVIDMLDKTKFLQGLNYLKSNYINWNFNLNDLSIVLIWYSKFIDLDNDTYKELIEEFTSKSQYAPNSPADILKHLKVYYSVEEAWQRISNIIVRSFSNQMFHNLIAKEEPSLYKFVIGWNIDKVGVDSKGNKCYAYTFGKEFKRQYKQYLDNQKAKKIGYAQILEKLPLLEEGIDNNE